MAALRARFEELATGKTHDLGAILTETLTAAVARKYACPVAGAPDATRVKWLAPTPGSPAPKDMARRKCNLSDIDLATRAALGNLVAQHLFFFAPPPAPPPVTVQLIVYELVSQNATNEQLCRIMHELVMVYMHRGIPDPVMAMTGALPDSFTADLLMAYRWNEATVALLIGNKPGAALHLDQPPTMIAGGGVAPIGPPNVPALFRRLKVAFNMDAMFEDMLAVFLRDTCRAPADPAQPPLRDYQNGAVQWMYLRERLVFHLQQTDHGFLYAGGILAPEPGMGKTRTTLAAIKLLDTALQEHDHEAPWARLPTLIIVPTPLLGEWIDENAKFFADDKELRIFLWYGADARVDAAAQLAAPSDYPGVSAFQAAYDVVLTTRDTFLSPVNRGGPPFTLPFRRLVIDEAQNYANADKSWWEGVYAYLQLHRKTAPPLSAWALSGTPFRNKAHDLLAQLYLTGYMPEHDAQVVMHVRNKPPRKGQKTPVPAWPPTMDTLVSWNIERYMRHIYVLKYGPDTMPLVKAKEKTIRHEFSVMERQVYDLIQKKVTGSAANRAYVFGTTDADGNVLKTASDFLVVQHLLRAVISFKLLPKAIYAKLRVLYAKTHKQEIPDELALPVSSRVEAVLKKINRILQKDPTARIVVFSQWLSPLVMVEQNLLLAHRDNHWESGVQTGFFTGVNTKKAATYGKAHKNVATAAAARKKAARKQREPASSSPPPPPAEKKKPVLSPAVPPVEKKRVTPQLIIPEVPPAEKKRTTPQLILPAVPAAPAQKREPVVVKPRVKRAQRDPAVVVALIRVAVERMGDILKEAATLGLDGQERIGLFADWQARDTAVARLARERIQLLVPGTFDDDYDELLHKADLYRAEAPTILYLPLAADTVDEMAARLGALRRAASPDERPALYADIREQDMLLIRLNIARNTQLAWGESDATMQAMLDRARDYLGKATELINRDTLAAIRATGLDHERAMVELIDGVARKLARLRTLAPEDERRRELAYGKIERRRHEMRDLAGPSETRTANAEVLMDIARSLFEEADEIMDLGLIDEDGDSDEADEEEEEEEDDHAFSGEEGDDDAESGEGDDDMDSVDLDTKTGITLGDDDDVDAHADDTNFVWLQEFDTAAPLHTFREKAAELAGFALFQQVLQTGNELLWIDPLNEPPVDMTRPLEPRRVLLLTDYLWHVLRALPYNEFRHERVRGLHNDFKSVTPSREFIYQVRHRILYYANAVALGDDFELGQDTTLAQQLWRLLETDVRKLLFINEGTRFLVDDLVEPATPAPRLAASLELRSFVFSSLGRELTVNTELSIGMFFRRLCLRHAALVPESGVVPAEPVPRKSTPKSERGLNRLLVCWDALSLAAQSTFYADVYLSTAADYVGGAFYKFEWSKAGANALITRVLTFQNTRNPVYLHRLSDRLARAIWPLLAAIGATANLTLDDLAVRLYNERLLVWANREPTHAARQEAGRHTVAVAGIWPDWITFMDQAWALFSDAEQLAWLA